jgi:NTP pyrophosphatase (non-canonical NTP hydrolase)
VDANEYQRLASRTLKKDQGQREQLIMGCLGLAGETGEFIDGVKKELFHGMLIDGILQRDELGDILWYIAALADAYGFELNHIMERNIAKLKKRYPEGFSSEASIARVDVKSN